MQAIGGKATSPLRRAYGPPPIDVSPTSLSARPAVDAAESVERAWRGWAASALAGSRLVKGSPMPSATPAVTLRLPDATKHPPP